MAAIQTRKEGRPVDIDPAWHTFDFETPGYYDYHYEDVYEDTPEAKEAKEKAAKEKVETEGNAV